MDKYIRTYEWIHTLEGTNGYVH